MPVLLSVVLLNNQKRGNLPEQNNTHIAVVVSNSGAAFFTQKKMVPGVVSVSVNGVPY